MSQTASLPHPVQRNRKSGGMGLARDGSVGSPGCRRWCRGKARRECIHDFGGKSRLSCLLPVTGTEEPGKRGVLRDGERGEPETAPGHKVGVAPERALPPDHGTPDHRGGEGTRLTGWREFEGTPRPLPHALGRDR